MGPLRAEGGISGPVHCRQRFRPGGRPKPCLHWSPPPGQATPTVVTRCTAATATTLSSLQSDQLTVGGQPKQYPSDIRQIRQHSLVAILDRQGSMAIAEAVSPFDTDTQSLTVARKGHIYNLKQGSDNSYQMVLRGRQLASTDALVKAIPGWASQLEQQDLEAVGVPIDPGVGEDIVDCACIYSLADLPADVQQHTHLWCDGTGPGDAPPTALERAVASAGELQAVASGQRGMALVQLVLLWDKQVMWSGTIYNPLVPTLLAQSLANPDLEVIPSTAVGGQGLTAIVCTKREPWRSWARHLAGMGVQAGIVAGSPFYKMLIGRMLGYKEANIVHHIQSIHGPQEPSPKVVAAVDEELRKLSPKRAILPWNRTSRRKKGT